MFFVADDGTRRSVNAVGVTILAHDRDLSLPPRLVGDLLHRRKEMREDAPRAEVDLGVDLHARDEALLPAVAAQGAAFNPKELFNVMLCGESGR